MHRSHLPLKTWFMAVHIVTSHSNGISALQLQAQLGLGSYKSAWLLLHKLRRAMVDPDRSLLEDLIEIDEATLPFRTAKDPATGGQGRSPQGKMRIAGAVELSPEGEPRRIRLAPIGKTAAHLVLPWIHQVFSNLKGWARGVYHGLRRKHLQAYLDEFVFRFNRRKTRHAAFRSLFRLATNAEPLTYSMLIEPEPCA